jgi:membrane peptidoglycan carboxypeptidase
MRRAPPSSGPAREAGEKDGVPLRLGVFEGHVDQGEAGLLQRRAIVARIEARVVERMSGEVADGFVGAGASREHQDAATCRAMSSLAQYTPATISRIYSGEGRIIDEFAQERRLFVPIEDIPDLVKHAFISAEDKNFYTHKGYDTRGMVAAAGRGGAVARADACAAPRPSPSR